MNGKCESALRQSPSIGVDRRSTAIGDADWRRKSRGWRRRADAPRMLRGRRSRISPERESGVMRMGAGVRCARARSVLLAVHVTVFRILRLDSSENDVLRALCAPEESSQLRGTFDLGELGPCTSGPSVGVPLTESSRCPTPRSGSSDPSSLTTVCAITKVEELEDTATQSRKRIPSGHRFPRRNLISIRVALIAPGGPRRARSCTRWRSLPTRQRAVCVKTATWRAARAVNPLPPLGISAERKFRRRAIGRARIGR